MTLEDFANQPAFPVNPVARSFEGEGGGNAVATIRNEVRGGLTLTDYIAIEFGKAFLSNPVYVGAKDALDQPFTTDRLMRMSLHQAKNMVKLLYYETHPVPTGPECVN